MGAVCAVDELLVRDVMFFVLQSADDAETDNGYNDDKRCASATAA